MSAHNDNEVAPIVGTVRFYKGQRYETAGLRAHARKDGSMTTLVMWLSKCADCASPFMFLLPSRNRKFSPSRRCNRCKRPGMMA